MHLRFVNWGSSRRTFFSNYTTLYLSFADALRSSEQQHQQQSSQQQQQLSSGPHRQQVTNRTSGQSVQGKNVKSNAMDDMFIASTVVQQIMTELSGAATEKGKLPVITKAVFRDR
jgi:hypothetical protein